MQSAVALSPPHAQKARTKQSWFSKKNPRLCKIVSRETLRISNCLLKRQNHKKLVLFK